VGRGTERRVGAGVARAMKVLTVVHDFLPEHVGGTEVHAAQLAHELQRRGHDVLVLTSERDLARPEGDWSRREWNGLRVIELVLQREYADVRESYATPFAREAFRDLLRGYAPDVVHFQHLAHFGAGCLEVAAEEGVPIALTLHDYHVLCERATLQRADGSLCEAGARPWRAASEACIDCMRLHPVQALRWPDQDSREQRLARAALERRALHARALACADLVISPSRFLVDLCERAGVLAPGRAHVLKAGYPGTRREPRATDPARALRVGYVGGIYPSKGVHVLVEALRLLRDAPIELEIHGVLEWFPEYVTELRRAAEGARVAFRGRFAPERLDEVLAGCDLLVVPSTWYENMPLTMHEAWRMGLPVVASRLGGMAEALQEGQGGRLFEPGNAADLARVLRELATDRGELLRLAQSRPPVPTLEQIADEVLALYARILRPA